MKPMAILAMEIFLSSMYCLELMCKPEEDPRYFLSCGDGNISLNSLNVIDHEIRGYQTAIENSLMDEKQVQREHLKNLKEALSHEQLRAEQMQTELVDIRHSFSENLDNIENKLAERIQKVDDAGMELVRVTELGIKQSLEEQQDKVNTINIDLTETIKLKEIESRTRLQEVEKANIDRFKAIEKSLLNEKQVQSENLKNLKEALSHEQLRAEQMQTELVDIRHSFSENLDNIENKLAERIQQVDDAGMELVRVTELGIKQSLEEQQDKVNTINIDLTETIKLKEIESRTRLQEVEKANIDRFKAIENSLLNEKQVQSENLKTLKEALSHEQSRAEQLRYELVDLRQAFSEQLDNIEKRLGDRIQHVEDAGKELVQLTKSRLQQSLQEQQDKVNIIYPNTFNKESVSLLGVLMVSWLIVLSVLVACVWRQSGTRENNYMKERSQTRDLQNNVLVISYDDSLTAQYRALVASACNEAIVNSVYVQQEEQIANMPAAKVCIMFVEYSERHVIIETPGLGLGSLKRNTAEAVNKNGSCLVIVYARDLGSRSLRSQQRYNENIACVTSQPELSVLEDQGRFFSIYSELTDFQKKCLRNMLYKQLNL